MGLRGVVAVGGGARSAKFPWDHGYGPLDWPRDGRELLRIKPQHGAYWKAENLDDFNGKALGPRRPAGQHRARRKHDRR